MIKIHPNSLQGGELLIKQLALERVTENMEEAELEREHTMPRPNREGLSVQKEHAVLASAAIIVLSL